MSNPPTPAEDLAAAELRAQRARDRLHETVGRLQQRLDPRPRAQKAAREARVVGETAVAIAKEQPAITGGAAAGAALLAGVFLARHRIARLFARPRARPDTSPATAGLTPVLRIEP